MQRTGILIILDGFGVNENVTHNAISKAHTPNLDELYKKHPHTQLMASENHVGLPDGFMGNSEVGHLNIGAGRIVLQDFSLISKAIQDGSFFTNEALINLITELKKERHLSTLHLVGLVSDGGVHSHLSHLFALLELAKKNHHTKVNIHMITDGRDTSPVSAASFYEELESYTRDIGIGKIVTISGRFYAMDRDKRWERTETAYRAIANGISTEHYTHGLETIKNFYDRNITDEFLVPTCLKGYQGIQDGEGVIFFNFRPDRARQLTLALTQEDFGHFKRNHFAELAGIVTMTPYDPSFRIKTAFEKPKVQNTLGEILSKKGFKQLRMAETEKYAHVTYFFNGGDEKPFDGEKRILIPSPKSVKTYDEKPEMSAFELTDCLLNELKNNYGFVVVNFANPDMVGHTGNFLAAVKAVETVDKCLGKIIDWVLSNDAFCIVTADHGNCEMMLTKDGFPLTSHTTLPVPFILIDPKSNHVLQDNPGRLSDIAPTLLSLWGITAPSEMTGKNLIQKKGR